MTQAMRAASAYPIHNMRFRSVASKDTRTFMDNVRHAHLASMSIPWIANSQAVQRHIGDVLWRVHDASGAAGYARCGYATSCP